MDAFLRFTRAHGGLVLALATALGLYLAGRPDEALAALAGAISGGVGVKVTAPK